METKILDFTSPNIENIILQGDVLAFPTETVYGLGIVYDDYSAFKKLCELKGRNPSKPFTIMVSNKEDISCFGEVNDNIKRVIDYFMPGEITLLLKAKQNLYPWLTLSLPTVGIRIPNNQGVLDLIKKVNKPILVTSCNLSNEPALTSFGDVYNSFNHKILGIVQGECSSNIPSTIVMIVDDEIKLIREGNISFHKIKEVYYNESCSSK